MMIKYDELKLANFPTVGSLLVRKVFAKFFNTQFHHDHLTQIVVSQFMAPFKVILHGSTIAFVSPRDFTSSSILAFAVFPAAVPNSVAIEETAATAAVAKATDRSSVTLAAHQDES